MTASQNLIPSEIRIAGYRQNCLLSIVSSQRWLYMWGNRTCKEKPCDWKGEPHNKKQIVPATLESQTKVWELAISTARANMLPYNRK